MVVEAGVAVALAFALDQVTLFRMPQGGSVTAGSMIPVLFIALRWGTRAGILTGVAFGLLQMLLAKPGYIVHPVQAALDYPVAFGLLGLAGLAAGTTVRRAWAGTALALAARAAAHILSGVVFFAQYAPEGQHPVVYSIVYNAGYMVPEIVISAILLSILLPVLTKALPQAHDHTRMTA
jgi:thiamine transporter